MTVSASVIVYKTVEDIDQGNDFIKEVREHLQGHVTAHMESRLHNHNPSEELTEEQESE